ncbi:MotA/TolQ/ExbB proton channel family protein [hydrothermal vent metagenome]|uniref:MotA/TolQ/ExbB proton channel family protein n=1 Tax=hydrothermal vent metagenome TaxID=652676 RepID=A0A1W1CIH5_9ZZZZ
MSEQLSILDLIINASLLVQLIMFILVLMSIYSFTIIIAKRKILSKVRLEIKKFNKVFKSNQSLDKLYQTMKNGDKSIINTIFIKGFEEYEVETSNDNSSDRSYQKMQTTLTSKLEKVGYRLSSLAMIGSIAPFIGLFGTVWGIMHSFIGLTAVKQATIAVVAPGIAEALIATAIGLITAIPATMAYNSFMTKMDLLYQEHENIINEIYILLQRR